jgi:aquaporin Z
MKKVMHSFACNYDKYLIEAWGLWIFMVAASICTIVFQHPHFKLVEYIPSDIIRRIFIGLAMGLTAMGIMHSSWGKKSGAHINPAVTITFLFLRKISKIDGIFYMIFQTIGGTLGVYIITFFLPEYMNDSSVQYVVTVPGINGLNGAIIGEGIISFILMFTTLIVTNNSTYKKYIGFITAFLITNFVIFEAPYSGFSMNPARTLASAIPSNIWTDWLMYMIVPPISMLCAALIYNTFSQKAVHRIS